LRRRAPATELFLACQSITVVVRWSKIGRIIMNTNIPEGGEEILEEKLMEELLSTLPTESLKELSELIKRDELTEEKFMAVIEKAGIKKESVAKKVYDEYAREYLGKEAEDLDDEATGEEE